MTRTEDGDLVVVTAGPCGYGNNVYLVVDRATGEAAFVDAPDDPDVSMAAAREAGVRPAAVLLTHGHFDHTASIETFRQAFGSRLQAHPEEPWLKEVRPDVPLADGDRVQVGGIEFEVIAVPGHTPGSLAYRHGKHLFVGDTLFPGGPGRTQSNADLQLEIASITSRLFTLPDDTIVYPGHGPQTTIGSSRAEYAVFASREHDPDLHGDVLWLES